MNPQYVTTSSLVGDWSSGHGILCRVWWSSEWARRTYCTSPGMSSVVCVLFDKGFEGAISLTEVGWSEVFSMDDCSLCLRELLFMSDCTTSCINTGTSSQVNGGPWLSLALLELLPLSREHADISRVGRYFSLLVSVPPPRNRVVQPWVNRCFGILVLYREEINSQKLFTCHSTSHLVGLPVSNTHVLLRMHQFCIKRSP